MRQDFTHLTLVIDNSGSMFRIKYDAENGVNNLIANQKEKNGKCELSLFEFNSQVRHKIQNLDINTIGKYQMETKGSTAMLDAIGTAINTTGEYLSSLAEHDRPALVIVAIITDGEENSSRKFISSEIKRLIKQQRNVYNWQFTFLCTEEAVLDKAIDLGFEIGASVVYNKSKSNEAYKMMDENINRMRSCSMMGQSVENYYTKEERLNAQ